MTTAGKAASAAAESIRTLNHATFPDGGGFRYPSDAYDVLGALVTLVQRLPQALNQIAYYAQQGVEAGTIASTYGTYDGQTEEAAAAFTEALADASGRLSGVLEALNEAHNVGAGF